MSVVVPVVVRPAKKWEDAPQRLTAITMQSASVAAPAALGVEARWRPTADLMSNWLRTMLGGETPSAIDLHLALQGRAQLLVQFRRQQGLILRIDLEHDARVGPTVMGDPVLG